MTGSQAGSEDRFYQRLLSKRIVVLGGEVNDEVANRICGESLPLSADDDRRDVSLYVNSPGGRCRPGWPSTT